MKHIKGGSSAGLLFGRQDEGQWYGSTIELPVLLYWKFGTAVISERRVSCKQRLFAGSDQNNHPRIELFSRRGWNCDVKRDEGGGKIAGSELLFLSR